MIPQRYDYSKKKFHTLDGISFQTWSPEEYFICGVDVVTELNNNYYNIWSRYRAD